MKRMPRKNATRYPKRAELVAKQCQQRTTREINFGGHSGRPQFGFSFRSADRIQLAFEGIGKTQLEIHPMSAWNPVLSPLGNVLGCAAEDGRHESVCADLV